LLLSLRKPDANLLVSAHAGVVWLQARAHRLFLLLHQKGLRSGSSDELLLLLDPWVFLRFLVLKVGSLVVASNQLWLLVVVDGYRILSILLKHLSIRAHLILFAVNGWRSTWLNFFIGYVWQQTHIWLLLASVASFIYPLLLVPELHVLIIALSRSGLPVSELH
jgi:hypothetical protein